MNVYCAAPIRGNIEYKKFTDQIPSYVAGLGHRAFSELTIPSVSSLNDKDIFSRDMQWLSESQCVIAEVTGASTGVGFEIAYSLNLLKIPVLALFRKGSVISAMISGCDSHLLSIREYSEEKEIKEHIKLFLESL